MNSPKRDNKKLYRIKRGAMLAGVCNGIGLYLDVDPTIIRLIWALLALAYGFGIVAYIAAALIIPEAPGQDAY